jgi:hypothetical protein
MRVRRLSSLFAPLILLGPTYLACQLVDPASDLDGDGDDAGKLPVDASLRDVTSEADGAFEATVADAGNDGDADSPQTDAAADADADAGIPDATPFCLGVDATLCDGFDQDGPVNAAPAQDIAGVTCDTGTISVIDGQLSVDHPANSGSNYSVCYLQSDPTGNIRSFTLDFDFRYQLLGDPPQGETTLFSIVSSVKQNLTSANDAGIMAIDYQLLLDGQGDSQFIALPYYPQGSRYVTYLLANVASPGIPQMTSCHFSLTANLINIAGTAKAICGGQTIVYSTASQGPPPGIAAPAILSLGYSQTGGEDALAQWSIQYDNALFRANP